MKYGLEVEFFGKSIETRKFIDARAAGLPSDDWPMLAEARGEPHTCPFHAVGSVRSEVSRIVSLMETKHIEPQFLNWVAKKDVKELQEAILRQGVNKVIRQENLFGLDPSPKNETHYSAGLHVSITNPTKTSNIYIGKKCFEGHSYHGMFDFVKIFRAISEEFEKEIKSSGRTPGFYEIKSCGRVEYRSLPATIIHDKNFDARLAACLR